MSFVSIHEAANQLLHSCGTLSYRLRDVPG